MCELVPSVSDSLNAAEIESSIDEYVKSNRQILRPMLMKTPGKKGFIVPFSMVEPSNATNEKDAATLNRPR